MAWIIGLLIAVLIAGRSIAGLVIEYEWWKEMGQVSTWESILLFSFVPQALAGLIAFAVLWIAHARGMKLAGTGLRMQPMYSRMATLGLLIVSLILAMATIDGWTIVRYYGAQRAGATVGPDWRDPVFGHTLPFYFFDLPFYSELLGFVVALACVTALIYWLTARGWMLQQQARDLREGIELNIQNFRLIGGPEPLLLALSLPSCCSAWLDRRIWIAMISSTATTASWWERITSTRNIGIPAAMAVDRCVRPGRTVCPWRAMEVALSPVALMILSRDPADRLHRCMSSLTNSRYSGPYREPYRRDPFGVRVGQRGCRRSSPSRRLRGCRLTRYAISRLLDNVRLWDWRAFHDTVTQIQALRPYYVFADTRRRPLHHRRPACDQVLLAPRELDIRQLPDARTRWINPHFIYTHGYGLVMADAEPRSPPTGCRCC